MNALTDNKGHDGMPARHGDANIKNICEKYRELLDEIDKDIRKEAEKNKE